MGRKVSLANFPRRYLTLVQAVLAELLIAGLVITTNVVIAAIVYLLTRYT